MDALTEGDLGRFKAEAIAKNLKHDLRHMQITALCQSIMTSEAQMSAKTADVLICSVDDDAARLVIGGLACCYEKPLLDIGTGVFNELRESAIGHQQSKDGS
jgi:hypothetical protein